MFWSLHLEITSLVLFFFFCMCVIVSIIICTRTSFFFWYWKYPFHFSQMGIWPFKVSIFIIFFVILRKRKKKYYCFLLLPVSQSICSNIVTNKLKGNIGMYPFFSNQTTKSKCIGEIDQVTFSKLDIASLVIYIDIQSKSHWKKNIYWSLREDYLNHFHSFILFHLVVLLYQTWIDLMFI